MEKERKQCHFPICESDRVSTVDFSLSTRYHELVSLTLYAPRLCSAFLSCLQEVGKLVAVIGDEVGSEQAANIMARLIRC